MEIGYSDSGLDSRGSRMIGCLLERRMRFARPGNRVLGDHDSDIVSTAVSKSELGQFEGRDVGIGIGGQAAGDIFVIDHVAQAVAAENDAVAVLELEPADVGLDLAAVTAQVVGQACSAARACARLAA